MIAKILEGIPLVAILRGVRPDEVKGIGDVLYQNGVRCMEVPLNSPDPFDSISILKESMPGDCLVGAGTVVTASDVGRVKDAGGDIIVTPNTSVPVIKAAVEANMVVTPGVATPSDAFTAVQAGATYLKLFPASSFGTGHLKAMLAVLPKTTRMLAVGGIGAHNMQEWLDAGAVGFGIASELYKAGDSASVVDAKAKPLVAVFSK